MLAVAVVGIGLAIASRREGASLGRLGIAGAITGVGVAVMHYTGMAAMTMPAQISYDPTLVATSVVIAVAAATVALWLALHLHRAWQQFISALVMGVAVCGMHYTGMAAATFVPVSTDVNYFASTVEPSVLAVWIAAAAALVLITVLITVFTYELAKVGSPS